MLATGIGLSFWKLETGTAVGVTAVCFIVYFVFLNLGFGLSHERDTFENPRTISEDEAGKMFRVTDILKDRIALVRWGYTDYGLGDLEHFRTYFYIDDVPKELRNVEEIFKVQLTNAGMTFCKVQVNGFKDKSKKPFEVLSIVN